MYTLRIKRDDLHKNKGLLWTDVLLKKNDIFLKIIKYWFTVDFFSRDQVTVFNFLHNLKFLELEKKKKEVLH